MSEYLAVAIFIAGRHRYSPDHLFHLPADPSAQPISRQKRQLRVRRRAGWRLLDSSSIPRFYIFALIFVIFDVEAVFLFPWAVAFGQLGLYALVEMVVFILILFFGLYYAWKRGALKWV